MPDPKRQPPPRPANDSDEKKGYDFLKVPPRDPRPKPKPQKEGDRR